MAEISKTAKKHYMDIEEKLLRQNTDNSHFQIQAIYLL